MPLARRFGRRRFIGLSAAAACVGCSETDAQPGAAPSPEPTTAAATTGSSGPSATRSTGALPGLLGGPVAVGRLSDFADPAAAPVYSAEAQAWVVTLDPKVADAVAANGDERLRPGLGHGLLALYQKCPHLGCRVPYCTSSGWFECMCHGTRFSRTGEHRDGPGPRGLDAFPIVVDGDTVSVDRTKVVPGAPTGTVVVDHPPDGPHCVTSTDH